MSKKDNKDFRTPDFWASMDELNGVPDKYDSETEHKDSVLDVFENNLSGAATSRRDFLKVLGFTVSSAAIAASCKRPVHKAIPYVIQPEEIVPGKSLHYASSFYDGKDFASVVVKTREGRPIKIEGNPLSAFNGGGTTARIQASILSLYDDARYKNPLRSGKKTEWSGLEKDILSSLLEINASGEKIYLFTPTVISPSTRKLIDDFSGQLANLRWIQYDSVSYSAIREANQKIYGKAVMPDPDFSRADVVVSFGADFLGSWIAPDHFIPRYASRRKLHYGQNDMLRHYQFESGLSLTGSNADHRFAIKPDEEKAILVKIYNHLSSGMAVPKLEEKEINQDISGLLKDIDTAGSGAIVLSGSNDVECQILVAGINSLLGTSDVGIMNYAGINLFQGNDTVIEEALQDVISGNCGAALFWDVNPVYDHYLGMDIQKALKTIKLSVSFSSALNETSESCEYICPVHHYLESWGDYEVIPEIHSLAQPSVNNLFDTHQFQDILLKWTGNEMEYRDFLKAFWLDRYGEGRGTDFWNRCLQDGVFAANTNPPPVLEANLSALKTISNSSSPSKTYSVILSESVQMGDGKHANNPWLQELPDPVAKVCWDNFAAVSPADAEELGVNNGDLINITKLGKLPVMVQPGQAQKTISVSLGYGRSQAGKTGNNIGINVFPAVSFVNGNRKYYFSGAGIEVLDENIIMALTQTHNSMEGRPIVRESTLNEYLERPDSGNELHAETESHHKTLYPDVEFDGFHWGLAVDLNACVGCNSCVISCQAENNIPVVGKDEVYRRRIMHWIKIDRYYSDDPENPKVSWQPNMCQHCDNAPCENVCPVSATNHSSEGINQMSYNRCIGTKYCINNCPYRARRFNWYKYVNNDEFDYNTHSDLGKMVLNPDVTVRSRGVVEKCSFCVQRIQEKKLEAKLENRVPVDGEIQPACVQACPAGALVFGNLKDNDSKVTKMFSDPRNYHLLEQLHTLPSVGYLTKIRNEKKA